eukprot:639221-Hanusia_phi.AAC.1
MVRIIVQARDRSSLKRCISDRSFCLKAWSCIWCKVGKGVSRDGSIRICARDRRADRLGMRVGWTRRAGLKRATAREPSLPNPHLTHSVLHQGFTGKHHGW